MLLAAMGDIWICGRWVAALESYAVAYVISWF